MPLLRSRKESIVAAPQGFGSMAWRRKGGRGLQHSKTLRESQGRWKFRQVLHCASPLVL